MSKLPTFVSFKKSDTLINLNHIVGIEKNSSLGVENVLIKCVDKIDYLIYNYTYEEVVEKINLISEGYWNEPDTTRRPWRSF